MKIGGYSWLIKRKDLISITITNMKKTRYFVFYFSAKLNNQEYFWAWGFSQKIMPACDTVVQTIKQWHNWAFVIVHSSIELSKDDYDSFMETVPTINNK